MPRNKINVTPGYRSGDGDGEAFLQFAEWTSRGERSLDFDVTEIGEYTLKYLRDTNEIALIRDDEILYSEEVRQMASEATHWTLEEFGEDHLSFPSLDVNGVLMTFPSFDDAAEMALWMIEDERDGKLPIIGILAHVGDPTITPCVHCSGPVVWDEKAKDYRHTEKENSCALALDADGYDPEGWSDGWVQLNNGLRSVHEGDYENDPDIWNKEKIMMSAITESIAQGKEEIVQAVKKGVIPNTVVSFSELHDHVDANEFGGLTTKWDHMSTEDAAKVQEALDLWIKHGGLIMVKQEKREFLVHLNVQIQSGDITLKDVETEIQGALEVGLGSEHTPCLQGAEVVIAMAEEI